MAVMEEEETTVVVVMMVAVTAAETREHSEDSYIAIRSTCMTLIGLYRSDLEWILPLTTSNRYIDPNDCFEGLLLHCVKRGAI